MNNEIYRSIVFSLNAIERKAVLDRLPQEMREKALKALREDFKGYRIVDFNQTTIGSSHMPHSPSDIS